MLFMTLFGIGVNMIILVVREVRSLVEVGGGKGSRLVEVVELVEVGGGWWRLHGHLYQHHGK